MKSIVRTVQKPYNVLYLEDKVTDDLQISMWEQDRVLSAFSLDCFLFLKSGIFCDPLHLPATHNKGKKNIPFI